MRMTKNMLEELVNELKRKNKILLVCLILSIIFLVAMTVFAFSEFQITYENSTTYTTKQNADTQGENSQIQHTIDTKSDDNGMAYIIAGSVIVCLLILTVGGVLIYGKSASKNHD